MMRLTRHDDDPQRNAASIGARPRIRPAAVAGAFYPSDPDALRGMIDRQLDQARRLLRGVAGRLPHGAPKAVIVPHAGYVYSGSTAALAYALLERGRGTIRRAVIVGPTHRVAVRGVACPTATACATPLGVVPIDVAAEREAMLAVPSMIVNDPTHAREHAVEVQIPFLQRVLGDDLSVVPLNAGDATPREVGDVIRALWGGPETVIVISSDLSHYHPEAVARRLDDTTIAGIAERALPVMPNRACGAYPVNGLIDACLGKRLGIRFLGCSTSGDDGAVALANDLARPGEDAGGPLAVRPPMADPDAPVVGYASFAVWQDDDGAQDGGDAAADAGIGAGIREQTPEAESHEDRLSGGVSPEARTAGNRAGALPADAGPVLLRLARIALERHLGIDTGTGETPADMTARHGWLGEPGASFVTLRERGRLRGCIGSLEACRPLGRDVAEHAVDAASRAPRFPPVSAREYPLLDVEVSVLSSPEPLRAASREALERALRPGEDGLIIDDGRGHRATFLPQVWGELPEPHDFVSQLLRKAGLPGDCTWSDARIACERYAVTAFGEGE